MGCYKSKPEIEPHPLHPVAPRSDSDQRQNLDETQRLQNDLVPPSVPSLLGPQSSVPQSPIPQSPVLQSSVLQSPVLQSSVLQSSVPPSPVSQSSVPQSLVLPSSIPPVPPPPLPTLRGLPRPFRSRGPGEFQAIMLSALSRSTPIVPSSPIEPSQKDLIEAIRAVSASLNKLSIKYAIVDGAGLMVLGSPRAVNSVPFVIYPPTQVAEAKSELLNDLRFLMHPRTRHTTFESSTGAFVTVVALSSPGTFKPPFDDSTELIVANDGVCVLNMALFLESKCGAMIRRSVPRQRLTDAQDIQFILAYMIRGGIHTTNLEVPSATADFIDRFDKDYPGSATQFHQVGIV